MKRALLLIVVPALLVALGFAQTPAASVNTDQTNIKGCLGGSDGNYTVVEDKTSHIFKITTSSVDLKAHLGHDVSLIGHRAGGASSAAADNTFAVTELNMISEHCAAAAAAPATTTSTLPETVITPTTTAAAPAATVTTPAETVTPPTETVITPEVVAVAPAETVATPPVAAAEPAATVTTPAETAVTPAAPVVHPTRVPAPPQRRSVIPDAAAIPPAATASTSSEPVNTPAAAATPPAATASTSSEPVNAPAAAATTPTAPARHGSLWLLISFAVLVIVLGILAPTISRWRKRKALERTGAQNLSFTREASSDKGKDDQATPRKVA